MKMHINIFWQKIKKQISLLIQKIKKYINIFSQKMKKRINIFLEKMKKNGITEMIGAGQYLSVKFDIFSPLYLSK